MDTITISTIIVGCISIFAVIVFAKSNKSSVSNRPSINIDFDLAKEREDKNRYFS